MFSAFHMSIDHFDILLCEMPVQVVCPFSPLSFLSILFTCRHFYLSYGLLVLSYICIANIFSHYLTFLFSISTLMLCAFVFSLRVICILKDI